MCSNAQQVRVNVDTPKRYENIKKSIQDKRLYRGLKLSNGLRALVISDPSTDKSAASLTVNVGKWKSNLVYVQTDFYKMM